MWRRQEWGAETLQGGDNDACSPRPADADAVNKEVFQDGKDFAKDGSNSARLTWLPTRSPQRTVALGFKGPPEHAFCSF